MKEYIIVITQPDTMSLILFTIFVLFAFIFLTPYFIRFEARACKLIKSTVRRQLRRNKKIVEWANQPSVKNERMNNND